jgi:hypothetical protein
MRSEAIDLVESAAAHGVTARLVGSAGIRLHCAEASAAMDDAERASKDLDVVVRAGDRGRLRTLLEERGWVVDRDKLVAMEGRRFAFHHPARDVELDVFVDRLEFCHVIELDGRWERHPMTVGADDLLLGKLQVHEPTDCDVIDAAVLLGTHDVGSGPEEELIDRDYVAGVLARDWGFHRDATANLERVRVAAGRDVPLTAERAQRVRDGAARLAEAIDAAHKTVAWRMRARVGERMQWWDDVNERVDTY